MITHSPLTLDDVRLFGAGITFEIAPIEIPIARSTAISEGIVFSPWIILFAVPPATFAVPAAAVVTSKLDPAVRPATPPVIAP